MATRPHCRPISELRAEPRALEASTESEWVACGLEELGHVVVVADPSFTPMYATARLQSLTRELDAAVAIDETTFQRTGDIGADFVHRGPLAIRGRTQRAMVYALPLPAHRDRDPKEDCR